MKKVLTILVLVSALTAMMTSCSEENIQPRDGGTADNCQFTAKGCA